MAPGEELEVIATDAGSARDIPAFLQLSDHKLMSSSETAGQYRFVIKCGGQEFGAVNDQDITRSRAQILLG